MPSEKSYMEQVRDDIEEIRGNIATINTNIGAVAGGTDVAPITEFWFTSTLVAALANVESGAGFGFFQKNENFYIAKVNVAGTYVLEIDWSRDGSGVHVTETVTISDNVPIVKPVALPFAKFRVKNTHATNAFTTHRTYVGYR